MCFEQPSRFRRKQADELSSKELWKSLERERSPVPEQPRPVSERETVEHQREAEKEPAGAPS